jgi:hypothetical protein
MIGCPKFDNAGEYVERLTQVFARNRINSVTVLEMEVPCCSGLSRIVGQALAASGRDIPCVRAVVSRDGKVSEEKMGAAPASGGLQRL